MEKNTHFSISPEVHSLSPRGRVFHTARYSHHTSPNHKTISHLFSSQTSGPHSQLMILLPTSLRKLKHFKECSCRFPSTHLLNTAPTLYLQGCYQGRTIGAPAQGHPSSHTSRHPLSPTENRTPAVFPLHWITAFHANPRC